MASAKSCAITGFGAITAAGSSSGDVFTRAALGRANGSETHGEGVGLPITGFDPKRYLNRKGLASLSRTSQLACAAASFVPAQLDGVAVEDVGVVLGSAWASLDSVVRFEREAHLEGVRFVDPLLFTETVANVPAGQLSIFYGWSAVNATIAGGTGAGIAAIEQASSFLADGRARAVVAGGCDELNEHVMRTLRDEGRAAECWETAPFAEAARGPIPAEGAVLLVLEPEVAAARRAAPILGRLRAAASRYLGTGDDARLRRGRVFVEHLLEVAGLSRSQVGLLVLSANGTPSRDAGEAALVREAFDGGRPPAVLPKAGLGETWGASGPVGVLVALEAMRRGTVPARPPGVGDVDGLSLPARALETRVDHALILDFAESGQLSGLVVSRGDA